MSLREARDLSGTRLVFSSGSAVLDRILGSGLRTGEMVEVFGASGTGKTQLAIQCALSAASAGYSCAYVDTEGQFRPERLASICESRGFDTAKILPLVYCIRADDTPQQEGAIGMVNENEMLKGCRFVAIDTVTKNFTLEFSGSRSVVSRQTALGAYLNRLARDAFLHDRAVLLLNRVASVGLEGEVREVGIGGETLRHFVQKSVWLQKRGAKVCASLAGKQGTEEVAMGISIRGLE
jgi:RecA/RadA recombinase